MREMKNSGVEWIGEIPKEWSIVPNKRIMSKYKDICEKYNGEKILSLTMNGVIVRDLDAGGKMPLTFDGYQKITKGNLLMCLFDIDVTPRCIGLIKDNGLTSPAYSQFQLSRNASAEYYNYYYLMLDNDKVLLHLAKNLRHSLTEDQLGTVSTLFPPLAEQHRIAAYLDDKCSKIDNIIEKQQQVIEKLKEYKLSVITEAVTKGLDPDAEMKDSGVEWIGEMPKHWEIHKFCWDYSAMLGKMLDAKRVTGENLHPYIKNADVQWGNINTLELDEMDFDESEFDRYLVKPGDLMICEGGEIGKCAIVPDDFPQGIFYQKALHRVRKIKNNGNIKFLSFVVFCMAKNKCFYSSPEKATIAHLPGDALSQLRLPYPPISEQQLIVEFLDRKCSAIETAISKKQAVIEKLAEYKKSLIYEVVTGKKEV